MRACCICSSVASAGSRDFWNHPLLETPNFSVIPSLGSLVEGWVLIVPKGHFICMGELPPKLWHEMKNLKRTVAASLMEHYGDVCAFEHGPNAPNRQVGCGVDHAHLHLVPIPLRIDLAGAARRFLPAGTLWSPADFESCRMAFSRGEDYLFIEQPLGVSHIVTGTALGGQIFRKAIATQIGITEEFNWREHPHLETVSRTIHKMQGTVGVLA